MMIRRSHHAISPTDLLAHLETGQDAQWAWFEDDCEFYPLMLTLAGMANSRGGVVIVGINGDDIQGVADVSVSVDNLLHCALSLDPPLITPLPYPITLDDKQVVLLEVPAGMPHIYMCDGRYVRREHDQNVPLKPIELRRLLIERGEMSFEMEIARGATIKDLDWEQVEQYVDALKRVEQRDAKALLLRRGCLARKDNQLYPTNAGILLFGKSPEAFVRSAEITAVRFGGEKMSDTFNREDITGTLPQQIRRAETFLLDHLRKGVQLKATMARNEQFEYPLEAARELVVNAVAHRDYSVEGDNIRLFLFKDHMEVFSPGKLPGPVTVDNIKDERFSRNPIIVQVLADMGYIERLGYGIDRILELMTQHNLQHPDFQERQGGFQVVLYNQAVIPPPRPSLASLIEDINIRQEKAIEYLTDGNHSRITNSELQQMFPDVHAETIRRDLADLVNKNILEKFGSKRGSYYTLKKSSQLDE
ncbi:MAG: putative DNA binding domain-containing protein [Anaerolineae bacterium]|nr:putative DNA binding domain-containing protein [Anaerolineae bacterium]